MKSIPWPIGLLLVIAFALTFLFLGCNFDPAAFGDAVVVGGGELAGAVPYIPKAVAGDPVSITAIASYVLNAILGAWGTYERRRRKKVENAQP